MAIGIEVDQRFHTKNNWKLKIKKMQDKVRKLSKHPFNVMPVMRVEERKDVMLDIKTMVMIVTFPSSFIRIWCWMDGTDRKSVKNFKSYLYMKNSEEATLKHMI